MQRSKALVPLRKYYSFQTLSIQRYPFLLSRNKDYHQDNVQNQILVEGSAKSRAAVLNRSSVLNALNSSTVAQLKRLYESWEKNPDICFVLLKGSGKAFCAGADVVSHYNLLKEGNEEEWKFFSKTLYSLAYLQGIYLKPHKSSKIVQSRRRKRYST